MTKEEILEKSAAVVAALWPEWWIPGRTCYDARCEMAPSQPGYRNPHDNCSPDLTEPAYFLRALTKAGEIGWCLWKRSDVPGYGAWMRTSRTAYADTPEETLLLALFDYVQRKKAA